MSPKRPMLDYYGGKWRLAPKIIKLFPEHKTFVDVFCGAGSILMRKPKSKNEIINDLHDEVINLFEVLRSDAAALRNQLKATPYSRAEYKRARVQSDDKLEQARRTIVKSWFGIGDSLDNITGFRVSITQRGSMANAWLDYVDFLELYQSRLRSVIIEKLDYQDILKRYDKPGTLFYLDPPYLKATRNKKHAYLHDWTEADHVELIELLKSVDCSFILSGYDSELYDLPWLEKFELAARTQKRSATEIVWRKVEK